jgi:O-antigen/teichoic acid export membrane protein
MAFENETGTAVAVTPAGQDPLPVDLQRRRRRALGGRAMWTLVDQAVSSLTNAALALVVARSVGGADFGAFSIALFTFGFVIGIGRAIVCDPFVIHFSDHSTAIDAGHRRQAVREASGASAAYGVVTGLLCVAVGVTLDGHAGAALLALGISLPGLLVQDCWRYAFFAAGRPRAAAANDVVWAVVQFAVIGALLATGYNSVFLLTLAWGGAALVAAAVGSRQLRVLPAPGAAMRWFRATRELNVRLGLDYIVNMGAVNLSIYLVGAIAGLIAVGAIRAAQILLGPLQLLFFGLSAFALPVLSPLAGAGDRLRRLTVLLSACITLVSLAWVGAVLLLPPSVGEALLGESWDGAWSVLLPTGVVMIAIGATTGPRVGLKALRRADLLLRVTVIHSPFILTFGVVGAMMGGARGAAIGYAVAELLGTVLIWAVFLAADAGRRGRVMDVLRLPQQRTPGQLVREPAARRGAHSRQ